MQKVNTIIRGNSKKYIDGIFATLIISDLMTYLQKELFLVIESTIKDIKDNN